MDNSQLAKEITTNKLISIIVPIYNVEGYLTECLDSILMQDYPNYELLLIDDKSSDGSLAIAQHYAHKHNHITLVSMEKNSGQSVARNHALQIAAGDYVIFVDSDDLLTGTHDFSYLVEALETNKADLVMTNPLIYQQFKVGYQPANPVLDALFTNNKIITITTALNNIEHLPVGPVAKLWKMSIIKQYDISFPVGLKWEDVIFTWHYLLNCNNKILLLNYPHYIYRQNLGSVSHRADLGGNLVTISLMLNTLFKQYPAYYTDKAFSNKIWQELWWIKAKPSSYKTYQAVQLLLKEVDINLIQEPSTRTKVEFKLLTYSPLLSYFFFNMVYHPVFKSMFTQLQQNKLATIVFMAVALGLEIMVKIFQLIRGLLLLPFKAYQYATKEGSYNG